MPDVRDLKDLDKCINFFKEKVEYNVLSEDMIESARDYIIQFGDLAIPAQVLIKEKLVNFMLSIGYRFPSVKEEADTVASNWRLQVKLWLKKNNLTEKEYLELESIRSRKHMSPQFRNERFSGSDDRRIYHNSSSYEIESPDSQKGISNFHQRFSNHLSSDQKSPSPLQSDIPAMHRTNSAEFDVNLNIDPREEIPDNQTHKSPVKPQDRAEIGSIKMETGMFVAVKTRRPPREADVATIASLCENLLRLPRSQCPRFVLEYKHNSAAKTKNANSNSKNHALSSDGKNEKQPKSTHKSHTSQNLIHKALTAHHNMILEQNRKEIESTQSAVPKPNEPSKKLNQPNLLFSSQHGTVTSSSSYPVSKDDRKKKHLGNTHPVGKVKEWGKDQQSSQDIKNVPSISRTGTKESLTSLPASKYNGQQNGMEVSHFAITAKKLKEGQSPSQNCKQKHLTYSDYIANGKHNQLPMETFLKSDDLKNTKGACAMALDRSCDKNHIKRRDSPSENAMLAITSSKKERTSLYHGRKSEGCVVKPLKDLVMTFMIKWLKQNSDFSRMLKKETFTTFEDLEPVLVHLSPEKLLKVEETFQYLKTHTDGIWRMHCKKFSSQFHLKRETESWCRFYQRCCMESDKKLRHVAASISASASKAKSSRQIMFTTVDCPPTKRQKTDHPVVAKNNANNSAIKPQPNSCHPSNSRSDAPVPLKGISNHIKPSQKIVKRDAPLMHKVKKTMGQLNRLHRTSNQGH